jgi:serine/threonine protein kinase
MSTRRLLCPRCRTPLTVATEAAGARVRCPQCATVLTVPAAKATTPASVPVDKTVTLAEPPRPAPAEDRTLPPREAANPPAPPQNPDPFAFLAPPAGPDELGRLGPYRILKVLGAGGMGVVFQAEDVKLRRRVALKAMLPALAVNPNARERFLREAQAAAAVEHDHVVAIYQVGEDRDTPYLAMQFLEGESLEGRLHRQPLLPLGEAVRIARETAVGLAAAHARGLVHRDIKPANIWLEQKAGPQQPTAKTTPGGRVKILDFGLVLALDPGGPMTPAGPCLGPLTQAGAILGTPGFMAPEQFDGSHVDARADLFSLGCVLYRTTTGRAPFRGKDTITTLMAAATEHPPPPEALNPNVPPTLSALILRLLAKAPDDRPQSAHEVAKQLEALALPAEDVVVAATASFTPATLAQSVALLSAARTEPIPNGRLRRRLLLGLGGLGLCLVLAVVLFLGLRSKTPQNGTTAEPAHPAEKPGPPGPAGMKEEPLALAAPDLSHAKPLHEDDFDDPNSGFDTGLYKGFIDREYALGRYRIIQKGHGYSFWKARWQASPDCACQIVGRVLGKPEARWTLNLVNPQNDNSIVLGIDSNGELHVGPGKEQDASAITEQKPIRHPAIRPGQEFNTLLAILKGRRLAIYVNGWSVCAPITLTHDLGSVCPNLGLDSPSPATAEFERIASWSPADLPAPEKRPTPFGRQRLWPADLPPGDLPAPRLTDVQTNCDFEGPESDWPAGPMLNGAKREYGRRTYERGLYAVRVQSGFYSWHRGRRYPDFAAEMTARLKEPATGRWGVFVWNKDHPLSPGIAVWLSGHGELEVGADSEDRQKYLEPHVGPFTHPAIRPVGESNTLLLVVRGQRLEVYVNGTAVCAPIPLSHKLTPAVLGMSVQSRGQPVQVDFTHWRVASLAVSP